MAVIDGLRQVELAPRHIDDACALVAEAGWNETPDDWRLMMAAGHAIGFEDPSGNLVASALTMPYGTEFGWISMVLVTTAWRRQGIASDLLRACIEDHESAGRVPVLDATPAGEQVYIGLGFAGDMTIQRWQCDGPDAADLAAGDVRPVEAGDVDEIIAFDCAVFGGDRAAVLRDIALREGARGWRLTDGDGFLLSREGRLARQLGPLCAATEAGAIRLVTAALGHFDEPVFIDVPDRHAALTDMLKAHNFTSQRPFRRMLKGNDNGFGDRARLFALAGPELG